MASAPDGYVGGDADWDEDGDWDDGEDDYDEDARVGGAMDGIMQQALPVEAVYDEAELRRRMEAGPPTTAEEYLLRVRFEAQDLPEVMTAPGWDEHGDSSVGGGEADLGDGGTGADAADPSGPGAAAGALGAPHPMQWVMEVAAGFAALRKQLALWESTRRLEIVGSAVATAPPPTDEAAWRRLCLGGSTAEGPVGPLVSGGSTGGPLVSLLLQLDEVATLHVFEMHVGWALKARRRRRKARSAQATLSHVARAAAEPSAGAVGSEDEGDDEDHGGDSGAGVDEGESKGSEACTGIDDACFLSPTAAAWLYALLARMPIPVPADTTATMRDLCRELNAQRLALASHATCAGDAALESALEREQSLACLIAVVAEAFGQRDLTALIAE